MVQTGHLESGESDFEAAVRETVEETGLVAADYEMDASFKHEVNYRASTRPKRVVYWLARLRERPDGGDPVRLSDEHRSHAWLSLEEADPLARRVGHLTTIELLSRARQHILAKQIWTWQADFSRKLCQNY